MQSVPKPLSVASLLASGSGCPSHPPSSPLPFCPSPLKRFHLRVLTLLASVAGFQVTFRFWPMGRQPDNPSLCPGGLPSSGSQAGGGGGSRPPVLLPWAWQAGWTPVFRNPTCGSVRAAGFPLLRPGVGGRCSLLLRFKAEGRPSKGGHLFPNIPWVHLLSPIPNDPSSPGNLN